MKTQHDFRSLVSSTVKDRGMWGETEDLTFYLAANQIVMKEQEILLGQIH